MSESPIPPTLLAAVRSGRVHGRVLAVFVEFHTWTDTTVFRPVKAWSIAQQLGMSDRHVYDAIRFLVARGYLEQGEPLGTARTFRIAASPPARVA